MWWPVGNTSGMDGFADDVRSDYGDEDLEFVMGSVIAVRAWGLDMKSGFLFGAFNKMWHAGENRARCYRYMPPWVKPTLPHEPPKIGCGCGFWAYFVKSVDIKEVRHYNTYSMYPVVGVAELYGRMTEGTRGVRAEKARILGLAPDDTVRSENLTAVYDRLGRFDKGAHPFRSTASMMQVFEPRFTDPPVAETPEEKEQT